MAKKPTQANPSESKPHDRLTLQMRAAIEWLASGMSTKDTAAKIDVHSTTISTWRATVPEFVAAEHKAYDDAVAATRRRLRSLTARAVQALEDVLDGTVTKADEDGNPYEVKADPQHRIAAAKTILDRAGVTEIKGLELTGANGGPIRTTLVDELNTASDDALRALVTAAAVVAEPKP